MNNAVAPLGYPRPSSKKLDPSGEPGNDMKWMAIGNKLFKSRGEKLPVICVFGPERFELVTPQWEDYEEKSLDCRFYSSDSKLERILIQHKPQVFITTGKRSSFANLMKAPLEIRKRWIHYDTLPDLTQLGMDAYDFYLKNVFSGQGTNGDPLVSVFTSAYRTGDKISRPFLSLKD